MKLCDKCDTANFDNAKYCSGCGYAMPEEKTIQFEEEIRPTKKKSNKPWIAPIAGAVAFFLAYFLVQQLFFRAPSLDKTMMAMASEINKSCPVMVDKDTRLDNVMIVPPNTIQYNYTLMNIEKDSFDLTEMQEQLKPHITNTIRTSPDMKFLREKNMTMDYDYKDLNGIHLFQISIYPEDYK